MNNNNITPLTTIDDYDNAFLNFTNINNERRNEFTTIFMNAFFDNLYGNLYDNNDENNDENNEDENNDDEYKPINIEQILRKEFPCIRKSNYVSKHS